jgi:transcription elongation GreA/GreB family factor
VAFFQARSRLDEARRDIGEALAQLRLSADSSSRHARAAHRMMAAIEPAANALEDALRRAVYTLDSDAEAGASSAGAVLSPSPAPLAPDAGSRSKP